MSLHVDTDNDEPPAHRGVGSWRVAVSPRFADPARVPHSVCGLEDRTADKRVDSRVRETRLTAHG